MRVVFLGPGSSVHVTRWVRQLLDRGHEVTLASMHPVPEDLGPVSHPLAKELTPGATSVRTLLGAVGETRRLLRRLQPDLVCAYYMASYGLLAALAHAHPWVGAAAGGDVLVDPLDSLPTRIRNRLVVRWVLRNAEGMLAWAPHVGARLEQLGVDREKILVQPRGVDQELFPHRPPRERSTEDPLRVLSVRWLKPLYRVDTLVEALGHLSKRGVPFDVRIAGDGPERGRLEALARERGVDDRVTFAGTLEPEQVPGELAWADVYVSTSTSDGASSSLFEAMSVGAYPVVTDIPANRGLIDPQANGTLFPVGDAEALAGALEALAGDDAGRRHGIERGRAIVAERLDYRRNMRRIESFLAAVARGDRPPRSVEPVR